MSQTKTFKNTVDNKEHTLLLHYEKEDRVVTPTIEGLSEPSAMENLRGLQVRQGPDTVVITVKTQGAERVLKLSGDEYIELRDLFALDVTTATRRYL